jgi:hypothetical protein
VKSYLMEIRVELDEWKEAALVEYFRRVCGKEPDMIHDAIRLFSSQTWNVAIVDLTASVMDEVIMLTHPPLPAEASDQEDTDQRIAKWWDQASPACRARLLEALPYERCGHCNGYHYSPETIESGRPISDV